MLLNQGDTALSKAINQEDVIPAQAVPVYAKVMPQGSNTAGGRSWLL